MLHGKNEILITNCDLLLCSLYTLRYYISVDDKGVLNALKLKAFVQNCFPKNYKRGSL